MLLVIVGNNERGQNSVSKLRVNFQPIMTDFLTVHILPSFGACIFSRKQGNNKFQLSHMKRATLCVTPVMVIVL